MAAFMDPFHENSSRFLPQEECTDQEDIGVPGKPDPRKQPQGNNKWNRNMYGQDPLQGKTPDVCPPVSEGDVQQKNQAGYEIKL